MIVHPEKKKRHSTAFVFLVIALYASLTGCSEIEKPEADPFYAETTPPAKQVFRWSNGGSPKSFDPARAFAAPETDIVRALFHGLTDLDPRTLREVPAIAEKWTNSDDLRVWTFHLRKDARWSNGKRITAQDFVRSWKRLGDLGDKAAHHELFQNIVGLRTEKAAPLMAPDSLVSVDVPVFTDEIPQKEESNSASDARTPAFSQMPSNSVGDAGIESYTQPDVPSKKFGVEALDDSRLQVTLELPDRDFPKLVANPIFRPTYGSGSDTKGLDADIVTSGPFTVASVENDGVSLDRSDSYWNREAVRLEHVRFVFKENAEAALAAYKRGEIDALTNAEMEPLAIKLLSSYDDFRQTTHSALNFYEFNIENIPFNDRRVREALAISIDRQQIADADLEQMARPAFSFLPLNDKDNARLLFDEQKAKHLLSAAGFPDGVNFPKIRLLINRNDTQQRVARTVARMWKQKLNLDTEIIVKELSEIEAARATGGYDLVRRGVVLPTMDEAVGIAAIFGSRENAAPLAAGVKLREATASAEGSEQISDEGTGKKENSAAVPTNKDILSETVALSELNAIPLYFPMAYSLVKPYVRGFEVNGLDATSLEAISIDSSWIPKAVKGAS